MSAGEQILTGCASLEPCPYKLLGGTISECGYFGRCIYKRPQEPTVDVIIKEGIKHE